MFPKSLFWALHAVFTVREEGHVWYMETGIGLAGIQHSTSFFAESQSQGPKAMMGLLGSNVPSKSPEVKKGFSAPLCKAAHPAGVAMVTSCNLAFTHRADSLSHSRASCIDCPRQVNGVCSEPEVRWDLSLLAQYSQGEYV